jgi:hypothetical protein
MITWALTAGAVIFGAVAWVMVIRRWITRDHSLDCWTHGTVAIAASLYTISMIIKREPWYGLYGAASATYSAWSWWQAWRKRRDRRRAASLIGAKSRALRDAIVKRAKAASRGTHPALQPR